MPKTKAKKREILSDIEDKIKRAKLLLLAKFNRLTVNESENLRRELKKEQGEFYVAKKTLLRISLRGRNIPEIGLDGADGQIAVVFGYRADPAPAKAVKDFQKEYEDKVEFIGGYFEGQILTPERILFLADLPGREELRGRLASALAGPMSGLVNVTAGNLRALLYALDAVKDKKSS